MTFDILRRTRKEKGSPPICIMQVLYFQIRPYFWTAIINTKTLAWFLCTPRIASAPLSTSPPGLEPMTFGAVGHPHITMCDVKQLKSGIWGIPVTAKRNLPRKPKNKTYYMKHTKPNLSDQNLPIQTYYTKPSKVDLWTFNLYSPSQFTLGYEVTELWFWDLTTCVTMWVLHNV